VSASSRSSPTAAPLPSPTASLPKRTITLRDGRAYRLPPLDVPELPLEHMLPAGELRRAPAPLPEVSERDLVKHFMRLGHLNFSVETNFYPLGSCTMKLNATTEMLPVTWPEFGRLHPFAPADQTAGYRELFTHLETWLAEITGFAAVSLQKSVRDRLEGIPVTGLYFALCWVSLALCVLLLAVGLWNASLAASEKGFYAMAFLLGLFGAVAVQKNVRDLAPFKAQQAAASEPDGPT